MTPYVARFVSIYEQESLEIIGKILKAMPDVDYGVDAGGEQLFVSCHVLARVVTSFFPKFPYRDGYYADFFEHSWNVTPTGHVLDVYPVGCLGGPIIIDGDIIAGPGKALYSARDISELRHASSKGQYFLPMLEKASRAFAKTMQDLGYQV